MILKCLCKLDQNACANGTLQKKEKWCKSKRTADVNFYLTNQ